MAQGSPGPGSPSLRGSVQGAGGGSVGKRFIRGPATSSVQRPLSLGECLPPLPLALWGPPLAWPGNGRGGASSLGGAEPGLAAAPSGQGTHSLQGGKRLPLGSARILAPLGTGGGWGSLRAPARSCLSPCEGGRQLQALPWGGAVGIWPASPENRPSGALDRDGGRLDRRGDQKGNCSPRPALDPSLPLLERGGARGSPALPACLPRVRRSTSPPPSPARPRSRPETPVTRSEPKLPGRPTPWPAEDGAAELLARKAWEPGPAASLPPLAASQGFCPGPAGGG